MIIDSHQHFWKFNPVRDSWITEEMNVIRRDFLPSDLFSLFQKNNVDGSIAVQADQSEEETKFLLDLATKKPFVKGVVGWLDICAKNFEERLEYFSDFKPFCGIRHIVQGESRGFLLQKTFLEGIKLLPKYDATYDILVYHHQLPEVISFVKKFPEQKFVLNHLGKPAIKDQKIKQWKKDIEQLKKYSNVFCKVSGMVTEADLKKWKADDFVPYLDILFNSFGIDRVMYGSDWPVCLLASEYKQQLDVVKNYISDFSSIEVAKIMGENAAKFYKIKE